MIAHTPCISELRRALDALPAERQRGFVRLSTPCRVGSPLGWLACQPLYPRLYWRAREPGATRYALLGAASTFDSLPAVERDQHALAALGGEPPEYFGGLAFDAEAPGWPGYGGCRFVLPRIVLTCGAEGETLTLNLRFDDRERALELDAARAALDSLSLACTLPSLVPQAYTREDCPGRPQWGERIERLAAPEQRRATPKVVLSRETRLGGAPPPNPWALLDAWQAKAAECFHFAMQLGPDDAFIGCPPERLYRRHARHLESEALAGTTHCGESLEERRALARALLLDAKNGHENQCVYQQILTQLEPLSRKLGVGEAHIVTLRSVQHIRRSIEAELHSGVSDRALLESLPPTPAVGGVPRKAALDFLREHEAHPRGWYAGAFGRVSLDDSDLAVAIRSARITGQAVHLYAGAGIVAGSRAEAEWRELDHKIADLMTLLHPAKP